ncbi:type IIL restriction-modification enzyme MmeI [Nannocystis sp.]|uniref:Eco57I restriction-modification methylase domain-containing protein n=1 Tax=Nannocystis sp. TaxID=1962667 RepID=UPI0025CDF636|nr:type IIL restriction-modification enzyme MmeI [Nannocystis sp.]MBK7829324.1 hypothetical protein [Nannocystis sp.]
MHEGTPAVAALHALVEASPVDPAIDPAIVHHALVAAILRLVLLRALADPLITSPGPQSWRTFLARSREQFAAHPTPLLDPATHPILTTLAVPDAALARCLRALAPTTSLGEVHESLLALRLERGPGDRLQLHHDSARRRRGSHYTPPALTHPLLLAALRPQLAKLADPDALLALRVCDPAMGCGAFLLAACDILVDHLLRARADPNLPANIRDARREVALACLHGVDQDPLAVELARLSLWLHIGDHTLPLHTLAKNLRHGDSLVGLDAAQLLAATWHPQTTAPDTAQTTAPDTPPASADALALRGDAILATFFAATRPAQRERSLAQLRPLLAGDPGKLHTLRATLHSRDPAIAPFHWPLEFPAVFTRDNPGFDLIVGNPPFFWGNRIGRAFGPEYRDWLQTLHPGAHGNSDLAAHFLRRGFALLRRGGGLGFITTNSISEAETRATGLEYLCRHGGVIHHAVRDLAWPGDASVRVATICVHRGPVPGPHSLGGRPVPAIASDLRPPTLAPRRLPERRGHSFKGVDFGGTGFLLDAAARDALLRAAPDEATFVWPVLNASRLVACPHTAPDRFIINFSGRDLAELETAAPHCLAIVRREVLPHRQHDHRRHRRERWWLYNEACPGLYRSIAGLPRVLVGPVVARHIIFAFADPHTVFTNALNIFAFADAAALALLQSRPHELWALHHASSLRCDPRYNPTTCFETYPFPREWSQHRELRDVGEAYHQLRADLMQRRGDGLTATYNRFHDPGDRAPDILALRQLHAELDRVTLTAHAWHDLAAHARAEFHADPGDGPPRTRLRWPDSLADEVHARLLAQNLATPVESTDAPA